MVGVMDNLEDIDSMQLTKFITKPCIIPEMQAKNKADALKELVHVLHERKKIPEVGPALDQIIAREATESTGIGNGIAVPHARVPGLKSLACSVGRVPEGLNFMAIDRKPVHLIFLICYPPSEQTAYLNFVATVAKLLGNKERLKAALEVPDADGIYALLEDASATFTDEHVESVRKLKEDPEITRMPDAHADLILLARLQLWQEMLNNTTKGKTQIKQRIETIRSLVEPRILKHYDRLMKGRPPALVSVEGDTCQGCFMRLSTKFVQQVRQDKEHIHTCTNCSRYIYVV